jgi:hypothetical protein
LVLGHGEWFLQRGQRDIGWLGITVRDGTVHGSSLSARVSRAGTPAPGISPPFLDLRSILRFILRGWDRDYIS